MSGVDHHRAIELIGQRQLPAEGLLLPALDLFGFGDVGRQAEIIQADLPERRGMGAIGEIRRDRGHDVFPSLVDVTGMESDRVAEEIRLRGSEVAVFRPILKIRADRDHALHAGGAALGHPCGETARLEGVFRVTMGVQQAHGAIRRDATERARPQPCLEKAALPCTLAACTIG